MNESDIIRKLRRQRHATARAAHASPTPTKSILPKRSALTGAYLAKPSFKSNLLGRPSRRVPSMPKLPWDPE